MVNNKFVDARIKTWSIHDIIWNDDKVTVTENSGIIDRIIIGKDKLDRYTNYDSDIGVTMQSISNKEVMWSKVIGNEEIETTSTMNTRNNMLSPKATVFFSKTLQNIGIVSTEDELSI